MGLLDQVIGQVLGQMGGPSSTQQPSSPAGPLGGLGSLLGGNAGKYAPLVMALFSLLASKNQMQSSAGSGGVLGDILGQLTGGQRSSPGGALGQGTSSGFDPFGRGQEAQPDYDQTAQPGRSASPGGFLNEIGSMMGGPSGQPVGATADESSVIGSGLGGLFEQFRRNGHGDKIESWVKDGPNQQVSPNQLEEALSPSTVDELSRQTGLDRGDLLSQLSHALPQVVDKLTPEGRMPTQEEHHSWL